MEITDEMVDAAEGVLHQFSRLPYNSRVQTLIAAVAPLIAQEAAKEIAELRAALSDMQMAYNNCANNADVLRDQRDELRAMLGEAHTELVYAEKFIGMREKMHPDGQALYREVIERIENLVS